MPFPWSTALVTGASSGIGEALARRLAEEGVRLVVVARSADRLGQLAGQVPVDVEVLPADLADASDLARVEGRLHETARPVDLVVNNAGFGANGDFLDVDPTVNDDMLAVNVTAVMRLTRAALPAMVERGHGSVMNVSSIASLQPSPGLSLYAATKAFVTTFGESLHGELAGTGVTVTTVLPGLTRTGFQTRAGYADDRHDLPDFAWQDPEAVAAEALAAAAKGRATVVTGLPNKILTAAVGPVPRSLKRRAVKLATSRFAK
jgi:uncharacterized protein